MQNLNNLPKEELEFRTKLKEVTLLIERLKEEKHNLTQLRRVLKVRREN